MRFAKWVFLVAGVYGLLIVTPNFFLEEWLGEQFPPEINHPELFYGFLGAVLAWQLMYLLIGSDPGRYRPAMLLAAAAKLGFVASGFALYRAQRVDGMLVLLTLPDALFGVLFIAAWARIGDLGTGRRRRGGRRIRLRAWRPAPTRVVFPPTRAARLSAESRSTARARRVLGRPPAARGTSATRWP